MNFSTHWFSPAALATVVFCLGCGGSRNAAPVSGKITVNGQPMADIGVTFEPMAEGAGLGSTGKTDASGNYTLKFIDGSSGALVGKHRVTFTDLQAAMQEQPDAGDLPPQRIRIPAKYVTEALEYEVKAGGTTEANFDLK
jgi:hypothetical protein